MKRLLLAFLIGFLVYIILRISPIWDHSQWLCGWISCAFFTSTLNWNKN